ncbi:hypothetical protein N9P20_00845 [Polaribacter sp.]|nr:hypothetical protein [Polaribacter sp.]
MSQLPITSRVKRSPAKSQVSGSIDPEKPAKAYFSTPGEDVTTTEEVTTRGAEITKTKDFDKNWDVKKAGGLTYAEWIKKPGNKEKEAKFVASQQEGTGVYEPDKVETKTTVEKGKPTTGSVDLKVAQKSDVMQPWEVARMQRTIKKEQRQIRKSKLKRRPEGTSRSAWRKQVKDEENAAEERQFAALSKRNEKARASGKRGGSSNVAGFDRNRTAGENTVKRQTEDAKLAQEAKKKVKTSNMFKGFVEKASGFKMNGYGSKK